MAKPKTPGKEKKNLEAALSSMQKTYGSMSIGRLGNLNKLNQPTEVLSTGSFNLDRAIGCGGLPKGRIIEIYGQNSGGKTLIAQSAIAQCQKNGGTAAFIDVERAYNPIFAASLGVDVDSLIFSEPEIAEDCMDVIEQLVETGAVDIIVVDSVSALVPRAEYEGDMGQSHVGLQSRLMSHACRKLTPKVADANVCLIFLNQIREKVGITYGSNKTTSGGNALGFYASLRLEVKKAGYIKKGEEIIGHKAEVIVQKNKVGVPHKKAHFDLLYNEGGIDRVGEIIDFAESFGLVTKSASWYVFDDLKYQGKDKLKAGLLEVPSVYEKLEAAVKEKLGVGEPVAPTTPYDPETGEIEE